MDPKQEFTTKYKWTREEIAERLNEVIENDNSDVQEFMPDDPRLTDKVCQDFVECLYDNMTSTDESYDRECAAADAFFQSTFE